MFAVVRPLALSVAMTGACSHLPNGLTRRTTEKPSDRVSNVLDSSVAIIATFLVCSWGVIAYDVVYLFEQVNMGW